MLGKTSHLCQWKWQTHHLQHTFVTCSLLPSGQFPLNHDYSSLLFLSSFISMQNLTPIPDFCLSPPLFFNFSHLFQNYYSYRYPIFTWIDLISICHTHSPFPSMPIPLILKLIRLQFATPVSLLLFLSMQKYTSSQNRFSPTHQIWFKFASSEGKLSFLFAEMNSLEVCCIFPHCMREVTLYHLIRYPFKIVLDKIFKEWLLLHDYADSVYFFFLIFFLLWWDHWGAWTLQMIGKHN